MVNSSSYNFVLIFLQLALIIAGHDCGKTRMRNEIGVRFNMGCRLTQCIEPNPNMSAVNLFQVTIRNPELPDETNFILSNIGGPPMVIATSSSQPSNLIIDWDGILDNNSTNKKDSGFHFNVTQDESIGLLLEKIILFNDTDKSGLFTPNKTHIEIDWADIVWDLASKAAYHKDEFTKINLRMRPKHDYLGGHILVRLAIPRDHKADRQKEVPHLKLGNKSISMAIVTEGLHVPPEKNFTNVRLAMTFVVVVQSQTGQVSLDTDSESLISDEYTPGVFRIKSLRFKTKTEQVTTSAPPQNEEGANVYAHIDGQPTPSSQNVDHAQTVTPKNDLGFLYWKEVAYTDRRKMISRTIDVFDSELAMPLETLPNISQPFYRYYKFKPETGPKPEYQLYRFELVFGKGDTSYKDTLYTDFSFVLGLGSAPQEQMFSFLVKIIISVCFCLPIVVMLAGISYLILRRFRRSGDTEPLLAVDS